MTNNDELALTLKAKASLALDAWNKFVSLPDDVDLERGLSLYEMSLLSAHDAASNPANILALLAERDADKKRIEMLEKYVDERDAQNQELLLNIGSLQQRIAELREYYEGVIADGSKRIAELEACVSNLQVNRPVVYGDGFYEGYWKARSEQSMSSEDENHG